MNISPQTLLSYTKSHIVIYQQFLKIYRPNDKYLYLIVEGNNDCSFYGRAIDEKLQKGWCKSIIKANNKNNVLKLKENIEQKQKQEGYLKNQVLYFIDKDLSEPLNENLPIDNNLYITDGYSIENSIYNSLTLENVLVEIYNFQLSLNNKRNEIIRKYDKLYNEFCDNLIPLMSYFIFLRSNNIKVNISNFRLRNIFHFEILSGEISFIKDKNKDEIYQEFNTECEINSSICTSYDENIYSKIVKKYNINNTLIRGKFISCFFVRYCDFLCENYNTIFGGTCPKKSVQLSENDPIVEIAPRCKIPDSLNNFIDKNLKIIKYRKLYKLVAAFRKMFHSGNK